MAWLPARLPDSLRVVWRKPLTARGLGGIAATRTRVIVSDRELDDTADVFRCFDARTGHELWTVRYVAPGKLDYGNSPRATPLIDGENAYLFGALGHLTCAELATGRVVWRINVRDEFDVTASLPWGFCGSPLMVDKRLIVAPGGEEGSVVALNPENGKVLWSTGSEAAGYGSFIERAAGGVRQVVGHNAVSLGGWDAETGKRLWTVVPPSPNDFNVPTPILYNGQLIVSTENNGTRLFRFQTNGRLEEEPMATFLEVAPDTHTPVVVGSRFFGVSGALYCLDLDNALRPLWKGEDRAFQGHVSLVASHDRLLIASETGELLLIDATAREFQLLDRRSLFARESGLMAHPAFAGRMIYVRGTGELQAVSLEP